jgi:D-beta-D-heptose 7-phosphate kinase/D-beta-D-heptose 1-phosphate adenosyltransferase
MLVALNDRASPAGAFVIHRRNFFLATGLVVIFEEDTPIELIAQVRPSVLVKGGDYTREQVVGHEIVDACGGEVLLVDVLKGHSTTSLVQRAREGKA